MPQLSDFRLGSSVMDKAGKKAGTLASVLVDEDGFEPRALVVKNEASLVSRLMSAEKLFVTDEVIVPISAVKSADNDQVRLSIAAADLRRQKPYLSYRLKPIGWGDALLKEAQMLGGGLALPEAEEVANKPSDEIEIDKDENVMIGTTGRRLGRVEELLFDKGEVVAVVVRREEVLDYDVVLPLRFLSRGDDLALFADLDEKEIGSLQPFAEEPDSVGPEGV